MRGIPFYSILNLIRNIHWRRSAHNGPALIMELMSPFKLATLPFSKLLASRS